MLGLYCGREVALGKPINTHLSIQHVSITLSGRTRGQGKLITQGRYRFLYAEPSTDHGRLLDLPLVTNRHRCDEHLAVNLVKHVFICSARSLIVSALHQNRRPVAYSVPRCAGHDTATWRFPVSWGQGFMQSPTHATPTHSMATDVRYGRWGGPVGGARGSSKTPRLHAHTATIPMALAYDT
jgi:hypothetical protein